MGTKYGSGTSGDKSGSCVEIEFLEYQRTAQEVTEATYRLGESREVEK